MAHDSDIPTTSPRCAKFPAYQCSQVAPEECLGCPTLNRRDPNAQQPGASDERGDKLLILHARLAASEQRLGDILAGCDIQRGETLYRQVPVVLGPGITADQIEVSRLQKVVQSVNEICSTSTVPAEEALSQAEKALCLIAVKVRTALSAPPPVETQEKSCTHDRLAEEGIEDYYDSSIDRPQRGRPSRRRVAKRLAAPDPLTTQLGEALEEISRLNDKYMTDTGVAFQAIRIATTALEAWKKVKPAPRHAPDAWKMYSLEDLGKWVCEQRMLGKRDPVKRQEHFADAQMFLDMMQANLNDAKGENHGS